MGAQLSAASTSVSSKLFEWWSVGGAEGTGRWRLQIDCGEPILVMNLVETPTGLLSNLSSSPWKDLANGER